MDDVVEYKIIGNRIHRFANGVDVRDGTLEDLEVTWDTTPLIPPVEVTPTTVTSRSIYAIFEACPQCQGGEMRQEHAHYRCTRCGWRDSCCDL